MKFSILICTIILFNGLLFMVTRPVAGAEVYSAPGRDMLGITATPPAVQTHIPSTPPTATQPALTPTPPDAAQTPAPLPPSPIPTNRDHACLRINFEVSGDIARTGTYQVFETSGRELVSWWAEDGWQDSGWFHNVEISLKAVHVRVIFTAANGAPPVEMSIVNPAPNTYYGWVATNMCHALEVGWP